MVTYPLVPFRPSFGLNRVSDGSNTLDSATTSSYIGFQMTRTPYYKATKDKRPHLLFTYGTMMKGNRNHTRITGAVPIGRAKTTQARFAMFCMGYAPGVVRAKDKGVKVQGEVYLIDRALLDTVDRAEGHPWKYRRESVQVKVEGFGVTRAWCYLVGRTYVEKAKRVDSGLWSQPKDSAALATKSWPPRTYGSEWWDAERYGARRLKRGRERGRILRLDRDLEYDGDWEMLGDKVVYRSDGFYWEVETGRRLGKIEDYQEAERLVRGGTLGTGQTARVLTGHPKGDDPRWCPECGGAMFAVEGADWQWCGVCDYSERRTGGIVVTAPSSLLSEPTLEPADTQAALKAMALKMAQEESCRTAGHDPDQNDPTRCYCCGEEIVFDPKVSTK